MDEVADLKAQLRRLSTELNHLRSSIPCAINQTYEYQDVLSLQSDLSSNPLSQTSSTPPPLPPRCKDENILWNLGFLIYEIFEISAHRPSSMHQDLRTVSPQFEVKTPLVTPRMDALDITPESCDFESILHFMESQFDSGQRWVGSLNFCKTFKLPQILVQIKFIAVLH